MPDLLGGLEFGSLIEDRAFDADWPAGEVERRGAGMCHGARDFTITAAIAVSK